jgi:hypothetical protein
MCGNAALPPPAPPLPEVTPFVLLDVSDPQAEQSTPRTPRKVKHTSRLAEDDRMVQAYMKSIGWACT